MLLDTGMKHGTKKLHYPSFVQLKKFVRKELTKPANSDFNLRNKCLFWQSTTDFQLPLVIRTAIWQLAF